MFEQWCEMRPQDTGITSAALSRPNELLRTTERAMAGHSYLEWARYMAAAELHRQLVDPDIDTSEHLIDAYALCAARLAAAQDLTQRAAELHLARGLALRDRLPHVADMLKHGLVAAHHIHTIIARTDLIDGSDHMADIDRDIADHLRRRGSWSKDRMRDMVDAIIFRRDPDLVREDREKAKQNRGVWAQPGEHGMGELTAILSAEDTAMIIQRLDKLASSVCRRDPRTKSQKMADALFAVTMAREFVCTCPPDPDHPCTADIYSIPGEHTISGIDAKIILHAITDHTTLDGTTTNPGYLHGHGVISADHVQDLATHPLTTTRPLGNTDIEYVPAPEPAAAQTNSHTNEPGPFPQADSCPIDSSAIQPRAENGNDAKKRAANVNAPQQPGDRTASAPTAPIAESPAEPAPVQQEPDDITEPFTGEHECAENTEPASASAPAPAPESELESESESESDDITEASTAEHERAENTEPAPASASASGSTQLTPTIAECAAPPPPSRAIRRAMARTKTHDPTPPPADEPILDLDLFRADADADKDHEDDDEPELSDHEPMVAQWEPLRTFHYSNPYRPTTALDTYIRARDLYCTWPGCNQPAHTADLDHTTEYNHHNPEIGGHTTPGGLKTLCRFHHLIKTHAAKTQRSGARPIEWLDDQHTDSHGRTHTLTITPEGRHHPGPAYTGDDLFPTLRHITWDTDPPRRAPTTPPPRRTTPRTAAKHARRHQERQRNREKREAESPPPF